MARYRENLPQLSDKLFLTDGGVETTLYFREKLEFPDMAAFLLMRDEGQAATARRCLAEYAEVAVQQRVGLIIETLTWRASADWGLKLGYTQEELAAANRACVQLVESIRDEYENADTPIVISGCLGPRGDGYDPSHRMTTAEAERYHTRQIQTLRDSGVDMIAALTLNYLEEAIGIAHAATKAEMPFALSFTVETDGTLPTGESLLDMIEAVDAATNTAPAYYMINCAHPTHFGHVLQPGDPRVERIRGLRANSSKRSHAELDEAPELDEGNPVELGEQYLELKRRLPQLNVLGGCCGTDPRHVREIGKACAGAF